MNSRFTTSAYILCPGDMGQFFSSIFNEFLKTLTTELVDDRMRRSSGLGCFWQGSEVSTDP